MRIEQFIHKICGEFLRALWWVAVGYAWAMAAYKVGFFR